MAIRIVCVCVCVCVCVMSQALVTACYANSNAPPIRQVSGVPKDRVFAIIISVLHKFVARMSNQNVVVNVTGGMTVSD